MKLYERIENNNFDEIDRNRAIELIKGGNGHLVYNENYFKLQKENEELKIKNNAIKRESEAYAEKMIRLDIEKQDYFEKYRYHLQQNESLTKEFSNVIPVQKVKDKIEEEIKYHEKNILDIENITMLKSKTAKEEAEIEFNKYAIVVLNKILQELIKESEEK